MRLAMHAFDFSQNPSCSEIDVLAVMNDDSQEQVRTRRGPEASLIRGISVSGPVITPPRKTCFSIH